VYVGFDTRPGAQSYARTVAGVLATAGLDVVISSTPCPVPALAHACAHDLRACGAVMVSASSAAAGYQGLALRGRDGGPVSADTMDAIERLIPADAPEDRGAYREADVVSDYIASLAACVDGDAIAAANLKVVVDPMYGSSRVIFARLLRSLGVTVEEIHAETDLEFASIHPRPEEPWCDDCERRVVSDGAVVGFSLDGDGDRLGVIDARGRLVSSHRVVAIVADCLVEHHGLSGRVVMPMSASSCLRREAKHLGARLTVTPIGFAWAYREVAKGDALLATDEFGGICVPAHLAERDALMGALLVLERIALTGRGVAELVDDLEERTGRLSYGRRDVKMDGASYQMFKNMLPGVNPRTFAGSVPVEVSHADGIRLTFDDGAWVLVRPARSASVLRVCAEASTVSRRDALLSAAAELPKTVV
jgi:phosphomannomutase